jgi:hypothetical protein
MASAIRPGTHASPRLRPPLPHAARSRTVARLAQPILLLLTALVFGASAVLVGGCNPERTLSPMPEPPERTLVITVVIDPPAGGPSREVELGHLSRAEDIEAALASLPAVSRAELLATGSCVVDDPNFRRTVTRLVDGNGGVRGVDYSDINGTTWGKVKARFLPA